jgi:NAD(P)H-hydrate epimerase
MLDSVRQVVDDLEEPPHVVAVDCPSGVDTDTGEVDPVCIPADLTVTMAAVKQGLLKFPAFACLGELRVVDIGLPEGLESYTAVRREVVFAEDVLTRLPERPLDGHKGTFGTALILAGSVNYPGASLLAGQAAYCVGTGLVTIAVPEGLHPHLAGHLTEATWLPVPQEGGGFAEEAAAQLVPELTEPTALLMGPGFGKRGQTGRFVDRFLATPSLPTTVLDADGLRLTARLENWPKRLPPRTVLTPHPGEMAALTGLSTADIQADRVGIAERFAREWEHVVVLKGAHTVVADPEGETRIIPIAHSALASAGTGDVLAGVIVGLMAQGLDSFEAAFMGAWLHARAGIIAADQVGSAAAVRAGDVCDALAQACR